MSGVTKKRYIANWSSMPAGFADSDDAHTLGDFAVQQLQYISPGAGCTITDRHSERIIWHKPSAPFYFVNDFAGGLP